MVTSANRHGNLTTLLTVKEALADLTDAPDVAIMAASSKNVPSTVINCRLMLLVIEGSGRILYNELLNLLNNE